MQANTANLTEGGLLSVDANGLLVAGSLPSKILYSYWHAVWSEKTVVAGTWAQLSSAGRTDYDDGLLSAAGFIQNTTHANNDEIHFGNLILNAGTYKVVLSYVKSNDCAIFEVLHGTTSLGTQDAYAAVDANATVTFTYSPTTRATGNLRLKATGKNGSSSAYNVDICRLEIIRTV